MTMRSAGRPSFSACAADSRPETTSASRITSSASRGSGRRPLSSIMRASSSGSRLPQLTPMRTGFPYFSAASIMVPNWSSRFAPLPTLPGLMRYFARALAQSGYCVSSLWPLKWKSPTSGTSQPTASSRARIAATAAAASGLSTVMRTSSEPARHRSATWCAVDSASAVSVLVIDWTTTGAPPPMATWSTKTCFEVLRAIFTARSIEREARHLDLDVRRQVHRVVVVGHAHVLCVADDQVEGRPALDGALAACSVQLRKQYFAVAVANLDP